MFFVGACTPLVKVNHGEARWQAILKNSGSSSELALDDRLLEAQRLSKASPEEALALYLAAARQAAHVFAGNSSPGASLQAYNFAVARAVELMQECHIEPWMRERHLSTSRGNYLLTYKDTTRTGQNPSDFRLIAADTLEVHGKYFQKRHAAEGLGAPFVAVAKQKNDGARKRFGAAREFGCVTALIRFRGNDAQIEWHLPMIEERVAMHGKSYVLAADFTAPLALIMKETRPEKLGLARMLRPEHYHHTAALTRLQPYDFNRIPVIFIHGLDSTPATWAPMLNELRSDPEIRRRYQFWIFSHPSGYAYPYTASLLRKELDGVNRGFPGHKPAILVGHSMGSLISRLMITDVGDHLWMHYFGKPPEKVAFPGRSADFLKESLIFGRRSDVSRAIFICGPHRGSEIASGWIGRLASKLVRTPKFIRDVAEATLAVMTVDPSALKLKGMPNSIDTLAPANRFVRQIRRHPIASGVPYHSIIGDRGRKDSPKSSDGVVPYWSAHLDGAASEKIVPYGHASHQSPEGIAEVRRILLAHHNPKNH